MLSGGFDPIHPGHIDMIKQARERTNGIVMIALNSDEWLIRKKGFFFQSFEHRKAILEAMFGLGIVWVVPVDDSDGTVCKALEQYKPQYFGNGGDRKPDNTPEVELCNKLGIELVWNLDDPSTKDFHSSFFLSKKRVERQWGYYDVLLDEPWCKVKRLVIHPGKATSKQYHNKRTEYMYFMNGDQIVVPPSKEHKLTNETENEMTVIEVQTGVCEEEDIVRV